MINDALLMLRKKLELMRDLGYRVSINSQKGTQAHNDGLQIMQKADDAVEILAAVFQPTTVSKHDAHLGSSRD